MKFKLTLLACFIAVQFTYAQKNSSVGVSLGASIPINDFASTDENNEFAGSAEVGYSFTLSYDYKLIKNFGLIALVKYDNNGIDINSLATSLSQVTSSKWDTNAGKYNSTAFMGGVFYALPIKTSSEFNVRFLAGALTAKMPAISATTSVQNNFIIINQSQATGVAFTYLLGAGFKFYLSNKISILANVDYSDAKVEFKDVNTYTVVNANRSATTTTGSTKFTRANITTGIAYKF